MSETGTIEQRPELPPWVRRFVYGFLALLVACALIGIEAWPLSAFKLFSASRDGERVSWQIVAVDPVGRETTVRLSELPVGFRNTTTLLREFDGMSAARRDQVCRAWAEPRREAGELVEHLRIYRKTTMLGAGKPPPTREVMWECGR